MNNATHFYTSVAVANREPNRDDLTASARTVNPEQLIDYELGFQYQKSRFNLSVNGYFMHYNNQLVLTGAIDDVGNPVRENVAKSYRAGIEIAGAVKINKYFWSKISKNVV